MAVSAHFGKTWWASNERLQVPVGGGEGEFLPYDFLYAALAACYYYTLESLAEKMKLNWESVEVHIDGKKRDEKVATLEWVKIDIHVQGLEKEKEEKFLKASELAGKYCSIHHTIAQVAKMEHEVHFK